MFRSRLALVLPMLLTSFSPLIAGEVRGRIGQFDTEANAVQLAGLRAGRDRGTWLYLAPDARITWGKAPADRADLAIGRRVALTYDETNGRKVVRGVQILGLRPARPAGAKESGVLVGVLWRIGHTEGDVVVYGRGPDGREVETTCWIESGVQVLLDGKAVGLEVLKEGDQVTVRFERRAGRAVVVSIQAGVAPAQSARAWVPKVRLILQLVDWGLGRLEKP
jgi:hypothetical protein